MLIKNSKIMSGIREQIFNEMSNGLTNAGFEENGTKEILGSILFSEPENPNKFRLEGETNWKDALDKLYDNNPNLESISEYYDIELEKLKELYESKSPCEFWVRDRYGNGMQIIYTVYDDNLTIEEMVYEMVDL